ncbi:MAG: hydroxyacid dehydrogenase [Phycisphaerae bacterium]|nr:hydroxyacid dehydrogenase [Phycisphaerae bacterium]
MKVLIADKFEEAGIRELKALGLEVDYRPGTSGAALTEAVRDSAAEILIVRSTKVPRETLDAARALKLVIRAGSGVDTIDVAGATRRGIRVCNCPGQNAVAVAELTIGLMIALDRRIVDETVDLRRRAWNKKEYSKALGLKGRTLGVVGLGRIGYEVARRAAAFEMNLLYHDTISRHSIEGELGIQKVPFEELLRKSDFITLHVPGGVPTHHLIGERELGMMKSTAFLINCSRGGVVDEAALADAVRHGVIAGAALDVYEQEPGAGESEFADPVVEAPHVYGTHHVGASTEQAQMAIAAEVGRIVKVYRDSRDFLNCVNLPEMTGVG